MRKTILKVFFCNKCLHVFVLYCFTRYYLCSINMFLFVHNLVLICVTKEVIYKLFNNFQVKHELFVIVFKCFSHQLSPMSFLRAVREPPPQDGTVGADADDEPLVRGDLDSFYRSAVSYPHVGHLSALVVPHLQVVNNPS